MSGASANKERIVALKMANSPFMITYPTPSTEWQESGASYSPSNDLCKRRVVHKKYEEWSVHPAVARVILNQGNPGGPDMIVKEC